MKNLLLILGLIMVSSTMKAQGFTCTAYSAEEEFQAKCVSIQEMCNSDSSDEEGNIFCARGAVSKCDIDGADSSVKASCIEDIKHKCRTIDGVHRAKCIGEYQPAVVKCHSLESDVKGKCVELSNKCDSHSGDEYKKCVTLNHKCRGFSSKIERKKCYEEEVEKVDSFVAKCSDENVAGKVKCFIEELEKDELSGCKRVSSDTISCKDGVYVKKKYKDGFFDKIKEIFDSNRSQEDLENQDSHDQDSHESDQVER